MNDQFSITESKNFYLPLNEDQALALQKLGRELRSNSIFWGKKQEDVSEGETDEETPNDRTVIQCVYESSGKYRVRVANAVGAIAIPNAVLYVAPKIPIPHFAHVAKRGFSSAKTSTESISIDNLDVFWELLATWCVTAIENLIRGGLLNDYKTFTEDLSFVRGRPNVRVTTQNFLRGRLEANCTFDELDLDHPLNRVIRAAAKMIAGRPGIEDKELSKRASRLDKIMDGVGEMTATDLSSRLDLRTYRYKEAFDLSSRVLGLFGTSVASGAQFGRTFLIPTPGLIEEGLRSIIRDAVTPISVTNKGKQMGGNSHFSINPDLVFNDGVLTGDVKYKIAGQKWNRQDVQQAAMFATGYRARSAMIATFSDDEKIGDLWMDLGALTLRRLVWPVQEGIEPNGAEELFVQKVKNFVELELLLTQVA